jgi:hypothetical protein
MGQAFSSTTPPGERKGWWARLFGPPGQLKKITATPHPAPPGQMKKTLVDDDKKNAHAMKGDIIEQADGVTDAPTGAPVDGSENYANVVFYLFIIAFLVVGALMVRRMMAVGH